MKPDRILPAEDPASVDIVKQRISALFNAIHGSLDVHGKRIDLLDQTQHVEHPRFREYHAAVVWLKRVQAWRRGGMVDGPPDAFTLKPLETQSAPVAAPAPATTIRPKIAKVHHVPGVVVLTIDNQGPITLDAGKLGELEITRAGEAVVSLITASIAVAASPEGSKRHFYSRLDIDVALNSLRLLGCLDDGGAVTAKSFKTQPMEPRPEAPILKIVG